VFYCPTEEISTLFCNLLTFVSRSCRQIVFTFVMWPCLYVPPTKRLHSITRGMQCIVNVCHVTLPVPPTRRLHSGMKFIVGQSWVVDHTCWYSMFSPSNRGFKSSATADLMLKRAQRQKRLRTNATKRKKLAGMIR